MKILFIHFEWFWVSHYVPYISICFHIFKSQNIKCYQMLARSVTHLSKSLAGLWSSVSMDVTVLEHFRREHAATPCWDSSVEFAHRVLEHFRREFRRDDGSFFVSGRRSQFHREFLWMVLCSCKTSGMKILVTSTCGIGDVSLLHFHEKIITALQVERAYCKLDCGQYLELWIQMVVQCGIFIWTLTEILLLLFTFILNSLILWSNDGVRVLTTSVRPSSLRCWS